MTARDDHNQAIVDQFSRQAVPFTEMFSHSLDATYDLMLAASGVGAADTVLDVACGPGLLTCVFAEKAKHVTGIDITAAMIEQAKIQQRQKGLSNLTWQIGDISPLPYPDASFSVVINRFAFHHFLDLQAVLREMVRVCAPAARSWWWTPCCRQRRSTLSIMSSY